MLKKTLLTALLSLSTAALASINLDVNLTLKGQTFEYNTSGAVIVDENVPTMQVFDELETIAFEFDATHNGSNVILRVQLFQIIGDSEVVEITEKIIVEVPVGQPAFITINEDADSEGTNGSLTMTITPSLTE